MLCATAILPADSSRSSRRMVSTSRQFAWEVRHVSHRFFWLGSLSGQGGLSSSSRPAAPSGYSGLSGSSLPSARCVRDFPEVYGLLEKNEVNLSSVSLVASILTAKNKDGLLGRIRNKSQKEVERIVADYRPPVSFRDRARPVCVAVSEPRLGSA